MKPDDSIVTQTDNSGKPKTYEHIENGKKRIQLMRDVKTGKVSKEEFVKIQKKMRTSGFLKLFFSRGEYLKAINEQS